MVNRRGEFNFALLFAIIAGAAILFLAIYGVTQIGNTERYKTDTEIGKKIAIITDPLSAGFASGSYGKISFSSETRLRNDCFADGFGKNDISVATRSGIGSEWNPAGGATSIHNKYIFGGNEPEGSKEFYVFSKPFEFPFEVSDLIFLTSENYCFISPPRDVEDELVGLNMVNVKVDNCSFSDGYTEVCFGSSCDVSVYGTCTTNCDSPFDEGYVEAGDKRLNYVGSLMYGAIFDSWTYDCNVQRLMFRVGSVARVLGDKAILMSARGCDSNVVGDLNVLVAATSGAGQEDLLGINQIVKELDKKEDRELCGLW